MVVSLGAAVRVLIVVDVILTEASDHHVIRHLADLEDNLHLSLTDERRGTRSFPVARNSLDDAAVRTFHVGSPLVPGSVSSVDSGRVTGHDLDGVSIVDRNTDGGSRTDLDVAPACNGVSSAEDHDLLVVSIEVDAHSVASLPGVGSSPSFEGGGVGDVVAEASVVGVPDPSIGVLVSLLATVDVVVPLNTVFTDTSDHHIFGHLGDLESDADLSGSDPGGRTGGVPVTSLGVGDSVAVDGKVFTLVQPTSGVAACVVVFIGIALVFSTFESLALLPWKPFVQARSGVTVGTIIVVNKFALVFAGGGVSAAAAGRLDARSSAVTVTVVQLDGAT